MNSCTTDIRQNGKTPSPVARLCGTSPAFPAAMACGCGHGAQMLLCMFHLRRVEYGTYYCGPCWDEGHRCEAWVVT